MARLSVNPRDPPTPSPAGSSGQVLNKKVKKKRPSFLKIFYRSPRRDDEVIPVANQVSGRQMGSSGSVVSVGNHMTVGSSATATTQNHTVASPRTFIPTTLKKSKSSWETADKIITRRTASWKYTWKGETIILRDIADKILVWVDKFKSIGDVAVSFDPNHAALPWSAFRFILQMAINDKQNMGAVLIGLEIVANLIGRPSSITQRTLEYLIIVTTVRIAFSTFETELASLLDDIATQETSLLKATDLAEAEYHRIAGHELQETSREISDGLKRLAQGFQMPIIRIDSDVKKLVNAQNAEERTNILKWLSDFIQWQRSSASTILWLRGIPGAGKTKLASRVIDNAIQQRKSGGDEAFAYFYCKRDASGPTDPEVIMSAIVKQLCCPRPLLPLQNETTIVIDALDEYDQEKGKKFLMSLRKIVESSTSLVKIFVSSRNDDDIVLKLEKLPNLWIKAADNAGDIERFVQKEVIRCKKDGDLLRGSIKDELLEKIISSLTTRSQGMFLWADLQIKHICAMDTSADIEAGLNALPESLEETYLEIHNRIRFQKGNSPQIAEATLMWVLCLKESLPPAKLVTIVSRSVNVDDWELSVETLLKICHNLLVLDRQSNIVRVAHLSVREFLEKGVGTINAHTMASKFCHMMDNTAILRSSLAPDVRAAFVKRYVVSYWIHHVRCSRSLHQQATLELSELLLKFLKSDALVSYDIARRDYMNDIYPWTSSWETQPK
ncbi:uncharacterized protein LAJ45_08934 [Morchella importuna]|uniref:uncharacterized protein n=1 Tax=Morchella importuna TaxID=1174673 RepID=UPI001E8CEBAC|nr:uncharacterized protein LAJ45_08934 [Morchella importuna]KAH8147134.1 hypothetical protein LAJ45_08934 [Morchella importuna]